MPLVVLMILLVVGQALTTYTYARLRGRQEFLMAARIAGVSLLLQVSAVIGGSLLFGITGALAGYAAGMLVPSVVCLSAMFGPASIDRTLSRRVTSFALYCWGANVTSAIVWSRIELFFLERYWGMDSVAMFAVALALTQLAIQGPMLLTSAVLASLAEKRGRDDLDGMRGQFAAAVRLLAALVFPICFGTAAIIPELLPALYGDKFIAAVPAAMVLVSVAALSVLSTIATSLVQALERSDFVFVSSLCGACMCAGRWLPADPRIRRDGRSFRAGGNSDVDDRPGLLVCSAAARIHHSGGCGAEALCSCTRQRCGGVRLHQDCRPSFKHTVGDCRRGGGLRGWAARSKRGRAW